MAYVSGRSADVFVSYAHADNEELAGRRWVSEVVGALTKRLDQELGVSPGTVHVWMDSAINGSQPLTEQLLHSIDGSATLLCILSPGYLNSSWCTLEWSHFIHKRQTVGARVFFVVTRDIDRTQLPPAIQALDLPMYEFWKRNPETKIDYTIGGPGDTSEQPVARIYQQLERLIFDMKNELSRVRAAGGASAPAAPASSAPLSRELDGQCIYLAEVTDDLDEVRDGVRTFLEQYGATVVPQQWYPNREPERYAQAVRVDLARSAAFVQLLGPQRGREKSASMPLGLPGLQHELATQMGKPLHRWRSRELSLDSIGAADWRQFIAAIDVVATPIEEFKALLLRDLRPAAPPAVLPPGQDLIVFVNSDRIDAGVADELVRHLSELRVTAFKPLFDQSVKDFNRERRTLLSQCHGMILVHGRSGPTWVRRQVLESARVLVERRQPMRARALGDAPPPDKPGLEMVLPDYGRIDCMTGVDRAALGEFVRSLSQ